MKPNIIELVVNKDSCIGCGVCDTICPVNVLNMDFNIFGMYEPIESDGCLTKCTLCIDVCPFVEDNDDEFEISNKLYKDESIVKSYKDLGNFVETFVVSKKDEKERIQSSSGGAGNSILKTLLDTKEVDKVLTVESFDNPDKLFQFNVFETSEELENTKGSIYYPTTLSEVLDYVLKNNATYAITVLPCFAKAIRLAQNKNSKLRKRIKVVIGLVCGQMKTKKYTEELSNCIMPTDKLKKINYRVKEVNKKSNQYSLQFEYFNNTSKFIEWTKYSGRFWTSRLFTPLACNNCKDTFAVSADITLMDAWLPEYTKDYRGDTLVIVRTNKLKDLFNSKKDINIKHIPHEKVFESQKAVVQNKHYFTNGTNNIIKKLIIKIKIRIQKLSHKSTWSEKQTNKYIILIKLLEKFNNILLIPRRMINKLNKRKDKK